MQFLQAVSHSIGAHTDSLCPQVDTDTDTGNEMDDVPAAAAAAPIAVDGSSAAAATSAAILTPPLDDSCEVCLVAPKDRHAH